MQPFYIIFKKLRSRFWRTRDQEEINVKKCKCEKKWLDFQFLEIKFAYNIFLVHCFSLVS